MFCPRLDAKEFPEIEFVRVDTAQLSAKQWRECLFEHRPEVLVSAWDTPSLPDSFLCQEEFPLRYICHMAGGVKAVAPRQLIEKGVHVTNWGTRISHTIAEHAMLLTLASLRNLPLWGAYLNMPASRIQTLRTKSLRGKRVGLNGFGGIARELVEMLRAFRVEISAYSFGVPKELFDTHNVRNCQSLEELFSTSDILIEVEALNPRSRSSVTESLLRLLPEDAAFINVGRGAVVDEGALLKVASEGKIRVALDAFLTEPLLPDSPWLKIPGACLSPHIGGPTLDALPLCGEFAMNNLSQYLRGKKLDGVMTLEVYDRAT